MKWRRKLALSPAFSSPDMRYSVPADLKLDCAWARLLSRDPLSCRRAWGTLLLLRLVRDPIGGLVRDPIGGLNRSAVGKTKMSFTSRRPQQLGLSTLTSLLACTDAPRRAILRHGYSWRRARLPPPLRGRPAPFPKRAPYPSIQSTLEQRLCPSRLRPPRLHPQGRRGLSSGRARRRPCGYNFLQIANCLARDGSGNLGRDGTRVPLGAHGPSSFCHLVCRESLPDSTFAANSEGAAMRVPPRFVEKYALSPAFSSLLNTQVA